jgi:uncharacterized protein YjbI with pentapeptide repeats
MRVSLASRVATLTALFIALFPAGALACSCIFSSTPEAFVSEVSIIINGTLEKTDPCANNDKACVVGTFRVNETFKGPAVTTIRISYHGGGDGSSCGYGFSLGKPQLIAAHGDVDNGFVTGSCTQYPLDRGGADSPHVLAAMRYRDSIDVFDRALLKSPSDAVLLLRKAAFLTKNREVDRGLETVEQLLAQVLNHRDALLLKAELLTAKGRDDDARRIIGALPAEPGPPPDEAMRHWVWMLARQGQPRDIPEDWRDFEGIELNGGSFFLKSGMAGANFRDAHLIGVRLDYRLHGADFTGASLTDIVFNEVDLSNATLRNTQLEKGRWQNVDLSGADLEGAHGSIQFIASKFDGLWAPWADLPGLAFLGSGRGAVFAGSNLKGSAFSGSDLTNSDFSNADLSDANLDGAVLTGASLRKADLRRATLRFAKLAGADLLDAVYNQATIWPDEFDPVAAGARKTTD